MLIIGNCLPLADIFHPVHFPGEARVTILGTERKAPKEKAQCLGWGILRTCDAMETEGLSPAGKEGEIQTVLAMFVSFLGGWVLGNQARLNCGVAVSRLCTLGV